MCGTLGKGAQGQVKKAYWHGKEVAVKVIEVSSHCSGEEVAETIEEMKTEATILFRIRHPNIVA
jgi:serine/threonine protein kinase